MDSIKVITRKTRKVLVKEVKISDLDINKFSKGFLEHNLPSDTIVYVRCDEGGNLELRGKKEEYITIVPDKGTFVENPCDCKIKVTDTETIIEQSDDFKIIGSGLFHWNSSVDKNTKLKMIDWFNKSHALSKKNKNKEDYCISNEIGKQIKFWCGDSFRSKEEIEKDGYKIDYFSKNDCFHKVKELRKGHTKEDKQLINVY